MFKNVPISSMGGTAIDMTVAPRALRGHIIEFLGEFNSTDYTAVAQEIGIDSKEINYVFQPDLRHEPVHIYGDFKFKSVRQHLEGDSFEQSYLNGIEVWENEDKWVILYDDLIIYHFSDTRNVFHEYIELLSGEGSSLHESDNLSLALNELPHGFLVKFVDFSFIEEGAFPEVDAYSWSVFEEDAGLGSVMIYICEDSTKARDFAGQLADMPEAGFTNTTIECKDELVISKEGIDLQALLYD